MIISQRATCRAVGCNRELCGGAERRGRATTGVPKGDDLNERLAPDAVEQLVPDLGQRNKEGWRGGPIRAPPDDRLFDLPSRKLCRTDFSGQASSSEETPTRR